jgi:CxxC motif-containing protein (DUF1111 family)
VVLAQQRGPGPIIPLPGLTPAQRQAFDEGVRSFGRAYTTAEGLGPVFNDEACADCHRQGAGTNRTVVRFGRTDRSGFDPLVEFGGSLMQSRGIGLVTMTDGSTHVFNGERVPLQATVRASRRSTSLLGLGFVDAVPDDTWLAIAARERSADPTTAGQVHLTVSRLSGETVVGKFGWKAQVPSLREFAGDALLNEMGITSPRFRDEVCPQGDYLALAFNPAPALNDDGREVEALTNFMTLLAPPPRAAVTEASSAGERVFDEIGCTACHRAAIEAGPSAVAALNRVVFRPSSDFLLHDMGSLGDGIAQGQATARDMRTAPLWGLSRGGNLLHDGSAASIEDAVRRHDGQAANARDRFIALDSDRVSWLLEFLRSL